MEVASVASAEAFMKASVEVASMEASVEASILPWKLALLPRKLPYLPWKLSWKLSRASTKTADGAGALLLLQYIYKN